MPTFGQFLDLIEMANGAVVAAVGLLTILVLQARGVWRLGSDFKKLEDENKALKAENQQLRIERDDARFFAITGAGMAERFAEREKRLR